MWIICGKASTIDKVDRMVYYDREMRTQQKIKQISNMAWRNL